MSSYTPDRWVIVEVKFNEDTRSSKRVFASWYGGYLASDTWRLSSGITKVMDKENHYEIHNESGSVYYCNKGVRGMSGYGMDVFSNLTSQMNGKGTIDILDEDALKERE